MGISEIIQKPVSCFNVPAKYGDNKIVLMVRDPWALFTYWEIRPGLEEEITEKIRERGLKWSKRILRVYEVKTDKQAEQFEECFNFDLNSYADNWYIHLGECGKKWVVDIGILSETGEFFLLARSNAVKTPFEGMSCEFDEKWMCPEELYYKMFALAGGYDIGKSSFELKELIERHLKEWRSSGGISSGMFGSASLFGV